MRIILLGFVCVALCFASPFTTSVSAQEFKVEIAKSEQLGKTIWEHDVAGWVATDELLGDKPVFEMLKTKLKGWVSYKDGKNYTTIFVGGGDIDRVVYFEASTRKRKVKDTQTFEQGRSLSTYEQELWAVRETLLAQKFETCEQYLPMNAMVFPVPDDPKGQYYGYLFSATQKSGVIVLGKHYRYLISADGTEVSKSKAYSNSCFAIAAPAGGNVVGAFATHLLADYPEEHHVFANLTHGTNLYVSIPESGQVWKIRKGKISKVNAKTLK